MEKEIQLRMVMAKVCPKCNQVYSTKDEYCSNEECHHCLLSLIFSGDPIKIPDKCWKCGQMVTTQDYEKGNFNVRDNKLAHQICPKEPPKSDKP